MSWYRNYRPTTISGLHLQSVRESLLKLMKSGNFPHASLFAGPKGTGKTSAARIIGALLNDPQNEVNVEALLFNKESKAKKQLSLKEPDPKSELTQRIQKGSSFVVTELDAASNRGIDDVRQLKEKMFLPPQEGKIAVYILDEAHMLTTEAFNALLKMLEEPPPHIVFILATTELHKIPETIVSRCAVIQFHKASADELQAALVNILKTEKVEYEDAAVQDVIAYADGSFRDGVKLLETAVSQGKLTQEYVQKYLHSSPTQQIQRFIEALLQKDEKSVTAFFQELREQGKNETFFYKSLLEFLHRDLLQSIGVVAGKPALAKRISHYLLTQFSSLPTTASTLPFLSLELKALDLIFKSKDKEGTGEAGAPSGLAKKKPSNILTSSPSPSAKVDEAVSSFSSSLVAMDTSLVPDVVPVMEKVKMAETVVLKENTATEPDLDFVEGQELISKWEEFLLKVRSKNSSIEAVLRSSRPVSAEHGKTKVEVFYQFHREQLQQPKFRQMLAQCMAEVLGGKVQLEFSLAKQAEKGSSLSDVTAKVNEEDDLIKLAKEVLM